MPTFRQFLTQRRITRTPRGDFTRDALMDRTLPNPTSWDQLQLYLENCRACPEAIQAAHAVWYDYRRTLRRR